MPFPAGWFLQKLLDRAPRHLCRHNGWLLSLLSPSGPFFLNRHRREKPQPTGFAEGSVNPDSSTDRNPDRSSSDDRIGATDATDIRPGGGSIGSAGSPRDSNKVFGQPGRCKRGSLRLLVIGRVPKQPSRVPLIRK